MGLSDEALNELRNVLLELGLLSESEELEPNELEEMAMFLLNLTAAAVKTRERMRMAGRELPPSTIEELEPTTVQGTLPGFD